MQQIKLNKQHTKTLIMLGMVSLLGLFSACDMMEGLYDDTLDSNPNQSDVENSAGKNQYYINATSYTQWIYINFHSDTLVITTSDINIADSTETNEPAEWDIAHHHYDVKTNGASVLMTSYRSIEELEAAGMPENATWVEDTYSEEAFIIDLSTMLEGYLIYMPGYRNEEGCKWFNIDLSIMPPIYTMRDNVLLYRFNDGTYAAIQLINYMSTDRYHTKGWLTVNYKYPIFAP